MAETARAPSRVLLIDDSRADRKQLRRYLLNDRSRSYTIFEGETGREGVELTEAIKPDCIVLDYRLPDTDGIQVLSKLRGNARLREISIVMLTGQGSEQTATEGFRGGIQNYLPKDHLTEERFIAAVHEAIDKGNGPARTENELYETQRGFALLIDAAREYAIFLLDTEGRIVFWNAGAQRVYGYDAAEVVGRDFSMLCDPADVEAGVPRMELDQAASHERFGDAGWRRHKDGSRFWADFMVTALRDRTGALTGFARITRKITDNVEREGMRLKIEAALRLRDEFLSIASHELKTPLTSLMLQIQGVLRTLDRGGTLSDERMASIFKSSDQKVQRLKPLVEGLLDVSRIHAGKLAFELSDFDLAHLVAEVTDGMREQLQAEGIAVSSKLEPVRGRFDRFRIAQVVMNLMSNALKYGDRRPISLSLAREGDEAVLSVSDLGIGIPAEDQGRIFERFERAIDSSNVSGLGLGLYLSRRIVEGHGGRIDVSSAPGQGSVFTVRLPLND